MQKEGEKEGRKELTRVYGKKQTIKKQVKRIRRYQQNNIDKKNTQCENEASSTFLFFTAYSIIQVQVANNNSLYLYKYNL